MRTVCTFGLWVLSLAGCVSPCLAQEKAGPTRDSQSRAARVLESGLDALGGAENIRRADKFAVHYKAVNHPPGQNAAFDAPRADVPRVGAKTPIDYSGGRYVTEGQSNFPGGYRFNFRTVIAPRRSFSLDVETLVAVHSGAVAWRDFRRAFADAAAPPGAGVLAIAYMNESRLALVDGATFQTLATLETGKSPHEVRVSPDGRSAYVAAGKTITAVDLQNRKVRAAFDLGTYSAHDVRVSRDGRRIWAACAGAQSVLEMDAGTGEILRAYKTEQQGSWFVEVTPDERKLYTPNLEGKSVSVIDRATGRVKVIRFEHPVYGIDITPDGKEVWVSGRDLTVIDTATDEVAATVKASEAATGRLRITADGKKVVVALLKKLSVFDAKTRRLLSETELGASPKVLTLSADGRRAFLTNPGDDSVSVVDIVAGKQLSTFRTGKKPDGIGWAN